MPGLDRTGPRGQGPRTGRQMGKCAPKKENSEHWEDDSEQHGPGWFGRGRRLGRGFRWGNGWKGNRGLGGGRGRGRA